MQIRAQYRPFGLYRAVLALLVVVGHFIPAFIPNSDGFHPAIGLVGVFSFFVLSGFVISEAVCENYRARPLAYMTNRILRIVPPYLFAWLMMVALLLAAAVAVKAGLIGDSRLTGFDGQCAAWNLVAMLDFRTVQGLEPCTIYVRYVWAVVVEAHFYAAVGITILLGLVLGLRVAVGAVLALSACAFIANAMGIYNIHPAVTFAPYFALGAIAFLTVNTRYSWAVMTVIGVSVTYFFYPYVASTDLPWLSVGLMAASMASLAILAHTKTSSTFNAADGWFGNLSYPLYLNQYTVEVIFSHVLPKGIVSFLAALVGAVGFAMLAERVVEPLTRPLRDLVRRRQVGTGVHSSVRERQA